jgi:hypothetical protein
LLHKEVARPAGIKLTRGGDCYSAYKPAAGDQGPLQLLPLPPCPENPILAAPAPAAPAQSSADQKLAAIKTYRRPWSLLQIWSQMEQGPSLFARGFASCRCSMGFVLL